MVVMLANGDKLVTDTKCEALQFSLQGQEFTGDIRILDITSYDLILGIDWLRQFRAMQIDWLEKSVSFEKDGKFIKLQMKSELTQV